MSPSRMAPALFLFAVLPGVTTGTDASATPPQLVSTDALMETVEWLVAPERRGRLAGDQGYQQAAEEMARRFQALGLQPGGSEGFLRPAPMECNDLLAAPELTLVGADGSEQPWSLGEDFVARGFTGSGQVTAGVVFAGYGLVDGRGWNDYGGVEVSGKVVLAFKQAPPWQVEGGWGEIHYPRPKAQVARDRGAVGLLLVSNPLAKHVQPLIGSTMHGPGEQAEDLPQLQVTGEVADALLAGSGWSIRTLQEAIDEDRAPSPVALETRVRVAVEARYRVECAPPSVVAVLPGSDASRAGEHVIVGAHLDHVGQQGDLLYPGANDNASGSAAVMGVARAMAIRGTPPARTVVFILFAGEEQGLKGAEAYVADPLLPLDGAVAMINADGVGTGEGMRIGGGGASPLLHALVRELDAGADAISLPDTWYGGGSDAQPFFDAGLPTLYFAADKGWIHLHQPSDGLDKIDPLLLTRATRLMYLVTAAIADGRYDREERQLERIGE